jgi:hypothetical protein
MRILAKGQYAIFDTFGPVNVLQKLDELKKKVAFLKDK